MIAVESSITAAVGMPLVIPVGDRDGASRRDWTPPSVPALTTDDGEVIEASLVRYSIVRLEPDPTGWLSPAAVWVAEPWSPGIAPPASSTDPVLLNTPAFWALVAHVPESLGRAGLILGGTRLPVQWVEPPAAQRDASRLPRPEASAERLAELGRMLAGDARDPLRRWRVGLLTDRVRPAALGGSRDWPGRLADPALEALAQQEEWRTRAALDALERADPALAADVAGALTVVVRTPSGALLPAWRYDDTGLATLRARLLDVDSTRAQRIAAARSWLDTMPAGVAWAIDESAAPDAAAEDDRSRVTASIGAANLRIVRQSGVVGLEGRPAQPPVLLDGHEARVLTIPLDVPTDASARGVEPLTVGIGGVRGVAPVRVRALVAAPPGLPLGPLFAAWDMNGWLSGRPSAIAAERATAALLQRSSDGWEIYVECRRPPEPGRTVGDAALDDGAAPDPNEPSRDVVRLHVGALGRPPRVITLRPPAPDASPWTDRWTARAALPDEALEPGAVVRLGVERIDDDGVRSTWPRPVLPGQTEIPRAVIDLSKWGGLGTDAAKPVSDGRAR